MSSLIKSYAVNYGNQDEDRKKKRVIDSNQAVSDRIKALSEILEAAPVEEDFADDFNEGLDAAQVDALLADQDEVRAEQERNEAVQHLVDEANEQADKIIEEANVKAEGILEEARARGEAEGNEKGYAEGLERAAQIEEEAKAKSVALDKEFEERIAELEPKMVEALTGIYSHVFGIDLAGRSDVVLYLLKDTIRNIDTAKSYLVHVSKDDHELVASKRDELAAGLGTNVSVEIIEDVTLSAGNCFIETDGGIFDCSIGTELELLAKELRVLSVKRDGSF